MTTNSLTAHLRTLRVRAGNPTIREIERLVQSQARREKMARSTIQDKLAGTSRATLAQVLSLVEALSDYARSVGAPLDPGETDIRVWRERVTSSENPSMPRSSPIEGARTSQIEWDTEPLKRAGMLDVAEIIESSSGVDIAEWLPRVIETIQLAGMNHSKYLQSAAKCSPNDIARLVAAIEETFPTQSNFPWETPTSPVAKHLITCTSTAHLPPIDPVINVALRRAGMGHYVPHHLRAIAKFRRPHNVIASVTALRDAALEADAQTLLNKVGRERTNDDLDVILDNYRLLGTKADLQRILLGVVEEGASRFRTVVEQLQNKKHNWIDTYVSQMKDLLPESSDKAEFADVLGSLGYEAWSQEIRPPAGWGGASMQYSNEPPF
ncbi:hypothetical protein ACIP4Y_26965 [Streptomyces sp. NPDC088810]|uniref:hypothetical protein n=1 Tax=Streptomyces sp. NPDC088810 TaxID=3365904 RepID=UPI003809E84E